MDHRDYAVFSRTSFLVSRRTPSGGSGDTASDALSLRRMKIQLRRRMKGSASMNISIRCIVLSMFVLCMALGAFAQSSTTGSITGKVVDSNGAAVPGVVVTVSSPNLIRAQTAPTNDQGDYTIGNLPPGRYAVNVAADKGFGAFTRENVEVNLSSTSTVDVGL